MRARLSSSRFVGRTGELAEVELAWREASGGRPLCVLVAGESGVGKSRLIGEFQRSLDGGPEHLVLRGEGVDQGDELPYAPLLAALRPLVSGAHPALEGLSPGARRALTALLPGLDDGQSGGELREGAGQLRLFEAVLELLGRLAAEQPVLLILEDLHWADRSTRTFVAFLVRSLREERLMLLLSLRSDELHRRHPLRPLLAELERLDRSRRVELHPFDRAELAEVLGDILGAAPEERLVRRLYARAEGNPLFTEELLAAGLDGQGALPQSLQDAFMLRIERLTAQAQSVGRAIAVGRRLDQGTLSKVCGMSDAALATALREAVAEQILVAAEDGTFQFRHALLREVLYEDLLPGERTALHLTLAQALDRALPGPGPASAVAIAEVAGHYASAGDQPAALRSYVAAAHAAQAIHAYGEAAEMAGRALELWPRVPEAEAITGLDHVALLSLAASAESAGGHDRVRAENLLLSALRELGRADQPIRRAALLGRLARVLWSLNRGPEGIETAQRALRMLPEDEALPERAPILAWLARTRVLRGRFRDAEREGELALRAAIAAGDRCAEAEVLNTLGMAQIALGREPEGIARLRRAMEVARAIDDVESLAYGYTNLADLLNLRGRTGEALEIAREALVEVPRWLPRMHVWLALTLSELALEAGEWEEARTHLGPPPERVVGTLLIFRLIREADLALGIGNEDRAHGLLEQLEPLVAESSEPQWIGLMGALAGDLHRRRRDLSAARAAVAAALDRLEVCTDDVMRIARVTGIGLRIEADLAERARDLREPADERDALTRAQIHLDRLHAAAEAGGPVEAGWLVTGEAEMARARGEGQPELWRQAAAAWDAVARPYPAAQARWRTAAALVEAGDRAGARELVAEALAVARRLGSQWLSRELVGLAERGRLELAGSGATLAAEGPPPPEDRFGLTPRERQVLALIAEGATNRQIGASLYMAEKTASVHVSRILAKLGVSSRTQAAALAHRQQLA